MKSITSKQGRLIHLFLQWDRDGNGRVDREEMLAALTTEGVPGIADEMDSLWDIFDPEGEGSVDFRSLKRTLQRVTSEAAKPAKSAEQPRPATSEAGSRRASLLTEGSPSRRSSCTAGSVQRRSSCAVDGQSRRAALAPSASCAALLGGAGTRRASCAADGTVRRTSVASGAQSDSRPATSGGQR